MVLSALGSVQPYTGSSSSISINISTLLVKPTGPEGANSKNTKALMYCGYTLFVIGVLGFNGFHNCQLAKSSLI